MGFDTFDSVIGFLEQFTNLERKTDSYSQRTYRLDRMLCLMECLGNPQNSYSIIHIAGSKGKGSTASFIARAIESAGFKCGLYMSPHVSDYRERFTLAGRFFDTPTLLTAANKLKEGIENFSFILDGEVSQPTTFELYTAYAFLLFKEAGCSWAVVETGLGGRLDATNIVKPVASVLTPIELEHTDILGDTLELIATEKAKIIKKDTPSFVSIQTPQAMAVFEKEAAQQNSRLVKLEQEIKTLTTYSSEEGQILHLELSNSYTADLKLKMIGDVQAYNCALALVVLRHTGLYRPLITEKALEENTIPGRMEKIAFDCPLYLDGAHTPQSIKHLMLSYKQIFKDTGVCIFGSVDGKKHVEMAGEILANFNTVIISKPGTFKRNNPKQLFEIFNSLKTDQKIYLEEDASKALELAKQLSKKDTPILVCGSFYMAGAVKEALCL